MAYQAWNIFADRSYRREIDRWQEQEENWAADDAEADRREELRYETGGDVRMPLRPKAGT